MADEPVDASGDDMVIALALDTRERRREGVVGQRAEEQEPRRAEQGEAGDLDDDRLRRASSETARRRAASARSTTRTRRPAGQR